MLLVVGLGLLALLSRSFCACQDHHHKIIPKSIFVLPSRSAKSAPTCPPGLQWDTKQAKCLNIFRLNQTAQNGFLLEKLRMRFPQYSMETNDNEEQPFQVKLTLERETEDNGSVEKGTETQE